MVTKVTTPGNTGLHRDIVVDFDAVPVLFVSLQELDVKLVDLVDVVALLVIADRGDANVVGRIDELAGGLGRSAREEVPNRGDFGEVLVAIPDELLSIGKGHADLHPKINRMNKHAILS
jgi:hypothetical protein